MSKVDRTRVTDIDYELCARCLTNCEAAQSRLNRRNRIFIGLMAGVTLCLSLTVFLALSNHWIMTGLCGSVVVLLVIAAWSQWKQVSIRRARFSQYGQCVEVIREVLPLAGMVQNISPEQSASLVERLNHLPIFESTR